MFMISIKKLLNEAIGDASLSTPNTPKQIKDIKDFLYKKFPSRAIVSINKQSDGNYVLSYPFDNDNKIQVIANEQGDILYGYANFSQQLMKRYFDKDEVYKYKAGLKLFDWVKKEYLKYKQNPSSIQPINPHTSDESGNESYFSDETKFEAQGIISPKLEDMKKTLENKYNKRFWIIRVYDGFIITDQPNSSRWINSKFKYHKANGLTDGMYVFVNASGRIISANRWSTDNSKSPLDLDINGDEDPTGKKFEQDIKRFFNNR